MIKTKYMFTSVSNDYLKNQFKWKTEDSKCVVLKYKQKESSSSINTRNIWN